MRSRVPFQSPHLRSPSQSGARTASIPQPPQAQPTRLSGPKGPTHPLVAHRQFPELHGPHQSCANSAVPHRENMHVHTVWQVHWAQPLGMYQRGRRSEPLAHRLSAKAAGGLQQAMISTHPVFKQFSGVLAKGISAVLKTAKLVCFLVVQLPRRLLIVVPIIQPCVDDIIIVLH